MIILIGAAILITSIVAAAQLVTFEKPLPWLGFCALWCSILITAATGAAVIGRGLTLIFCC